MVTKADQDSVTEKSRLLQLEEQEIRRELSWGGFQKLIGSVVLGIGPKSWEFDGPEAAAELFFSNLKESVEDKTADIYVVTSILRCHRYRQFGAAETGHWLESYRMWKCMLCAFLQIIVTPLVAIEQTYATFDGTDQDTCSTDMSFENIVGKAVAFGFSFYVLVLFLKTQLNHNHSDNAGNYLIFQRHYVPTSVRSVIFLWGKSVNIACEYITSLSAVVLIWSSDDAMDIILNSLAIFFINELDDVLVDDAEYKRAKHLLDLVEMDADFASLDPSKKYRRMSPLVNYLKILVAISSIFCLIVLFAAPYFMLVCFGTSGDD